MIQQRMLELVIIETLTSPAFVTLDIAGAHQRYVPSPLEPTVTEPHVGATSAAQEAAEQVGMAGSTAPSVAYGTFGHGSARPRHQLRLHNLWIIAGYWLAPRCSYNPLVLWSDFMGLVGADHGVGLEQPGDRAGVPAFLA